MLNLPDVTAFDEGGNKFVKHVEVRRVINFGWPCEYNVDHLNGHGLCIDAGGRNHLGLGQFVDIKA